MGKNSAYFLIIAGLIITMGGVGGIETSVNDEQMLGSAIFAILGLLTMYAGSLGLRNADFYDRG
jgi:uncharacterized membrane protein HdeD (DUF308 family)